MHISKFDDYQRNYFSLDNIFRKLKHLPDAGQSQ
jgi:hypothetical protein